jgi:ankyrin repeat protein
MSGNKTLSRKKFLSAGLLMTTGSLVTRAAASIEPQEKPAPIAMEMVKEFVRLAHSDLGKVKEMLSAQPLLLNSSWDWGGGDFETALGAAGHMGLKEMAGYLLDKGARSDIFVLTMLGKTAIVKSMLYDFPALLNAAGPHGFTLLHHAEKGGKEGEELSEYLQSLGLKERHRKLYS